ncbi:MAG: FAD-binding protein [Chloroflexi bacterium]|nr:FAD-binding protein [Chloroflexota bacterium]
MINQGVINRLIEIVGERYVLYVPEDLLVYEYDGSQAMGYPEVVVVPSSTEEISQVVKIARRENIPIVPRGAGTSISGGAIAASGGILMAMTRLKRVLEVDPDNMIAVVEPGLVNIDLTRAVSRYGLFYAPDPSSQKACTMGGNVAENAGGPHCLSYGVTVNHVLGLEVVLSDGEVMWVGGKVKDTPGYDLTGVIVGSEGTFVIVTKIIVRLMRQPRAVKTFVAIYDDIVDASDTVSAIIGQGIVPAALEMMDNIVIRAVEPVIHAGYPLDADAVLLVEVEGMAESVEEEARAIEVICKENKATDVRVATDPQAREKLWAGRKNAFGALGSIAPNYYIVDGVVPRSKLPGVMKRVAEICRRYEVSVANVLHAGDGNLHPIILFNERDEGMKEKVLEAGGEIMRVCIDAGGALTGEHGIGIEKQMYMPWSFTEEDMDAMRRLRGAFSSAGFFNPGKIFPDEAVDGKAWELPRLVAKGSGMYV